LSLIQTNSYEAVELLYLSLSVDQQIRYLGTFWLRVTLDLNNLAAHNHFT